MAETKEPVFEESIVTTLGKGLLPFIVFAAPHFAETYGPPSITEHLFNDKLDLERFNLADFSITVAGAGALLTLVGILIFDGRRSRP